MVSNPLSFYNIFRSVYPSLGSNYHSNFLFLHSDKEKCEKIVYFCVNLAQMCLLNFLVFVVLTIFKNFFYCILMVLLSKYVYRI